MAVVALGVELSPCLAAFVAVGEALGQVNLESLERRDRWAAGAMRSSGLAHLGELDREFTDRERVVRRVK